MEPRMKTSAGVTLIELMVTLVVLVVLGTVAVPSYRNFISTQRIRSASYDLMSSLLFARSEAVKRNTLVNVTQGTGGWSNGWTISVGTTLLRTQNAYPSGLTIANSASLSTLTYANDGRLATAATDFTIAFTGAPSTVSPRCVSLKPGGMPATKMGSC